MVTRPYGRNEHQWDVCWQVAAQCGCQHDMIRKDSRHPLLIEKERVANEPSVRNIRRDRGEKDICIAGGRDRRSQ